MLRVYLSRYVSVSTCEYSIKIPQNVQEKKISQQKFQIASKVLLFALKIAFNAIKSRLPTKIAETNESKEISFVGYTVYSSHKQFTL